jgi:hypothetical protein
MKNVQLFKILAMFGGSILFDWNSEMKDKTLIIKKFLFDWNSENGKNE